MKTTTFLALLALHLPVIGHAVPAPDRLQAAPPAAADVALPTYLELARSELKARKTVLLAQNLPLTEEEATIFWPLRNEYEAELDHLVQRKLELVRRHIRHYDQLTDREATELVQEHFVLELKLTALKQNYFKRFTAALTAVKAARFFQSESMVNHEFSLMIEQTLPAVNWSHTQ